MNAELTLEGYAEVTALRRHFGRDVAAEVLARVDVTEAAWLRALTDWPARIAAECSSGGLTLGLRFGRALAAARDRLVAEKPVIETLGPLPEEVPSEPAPTTVVETPSAPLPVPVAVPMLEPPPPSMSTDPWSGPCPSYMLQPESLRAGTSPWSVAPSAPCETTAFVPVLRPDADHTLPFLALSALPDPQLTLQQYASLFAELSVAPGNADAVLARYGVGDGPARRNLEKAWRSKFRAETGLRDRFYELVAGYQTWLRERL